MITVRRHLRQGRIVRRYSRKHFYVRLGSGRFKNLSARYVDKGVRRGDILIENLSGDEQEAADVLAHEELHKALGENVGRKATRGLHGVQDSKSFEFNPRLARLTQYITGTDEYIGKLKKQEKEDKSEIKSATVYRNALVDRYYEEKDA